MLSSSIPPAATWVTQSFTSQPYVRTCPWPHAFQPAAQQDAGQTTAAHCSSHSTDTIHNSSKPQHQNTPAMALTFFSTSLYASSNSAASSPAPAPALSGLGTTSMQLQGRLLSAAAPRSWPHRSSEQQQIVSTHETAHSQHKQEQPAAADCQQQARQHGHQPGQPLSVLQLCER